MRTMKLLAAIAAVSMLSVPVMAQTYRTAPGGAPATAPSQEPGFALTIYSTADPATFDPQQLALQRLMNPYNRWQMQLPGYGVVRETRNIDLKGGDNTVKFTDVAKGIDPTTVAFESLTAPDSTAVIEQNYEYDVTSADKLLEKYLGKEVTIDLRAAGGSSARDSVTGTLLSAEPGTLMLQSKEGDVRVLTRGDVVSVYLAKQSSQLITKPTLVWKLSAEQAGKHAAQVTYQTSGLTWRADYNLVVNANDTATDVGAWVTIMNESGAAYPDAHLKLVAGDVQRVRPPQQVYMGAQLAEARGGADRSGGFAEKSFFEYHLYTLGRTTTLNDGSTKQIELFPSRSNVPVEKTFVYYGLPEQWRYWIAPQPNADQNLGTESNKKVDIYLLLKNSENNGMGIPLPAGRVRVYKRDEADSNLEFIGEDVIQHTPKDEQLMVKLGNAFDIVGERRQTDFKANYDGHVITESFEIKLRNHKREPVKVIVKENLFRWVNWEITRSSDKWEKQDYRTIHIPVDVPPEGEKVVTYTVKYTW